MLLLQNDELILNMVHLKIDNIDTTVQSGTTILKAAEKLGLTIPTMCFKEGYSNHPSCMVCVVKDRRTNALIPSCAMPVENGMDIITNDNEVIDARKEALELLMSDHVGDCEAPCRTACPAFMNIPEMNRLIASGKYRDALRVVKEDIALPFILGYICSAPCEKVCRRKQVDKAVSICMLKRFVAKIDALDHSSYIPEKNPLTGKRVAVIGTGPAGLACAFYLIKLGHDCTLFEMSSVAGGTLTHLQEDILPKSVLEYEIDLIRKFGADILLNQQITPKRFDTEISNNFDAVVIATGEFDKSNLIEFGFEATRTGLQVDTKTYMSVQKGIFACGSVIHPQKMAIKALAQGKEAAFSVNEYLMGMKTISKSDIFNSKFGLLMTSEIQEYLKESSPVDRVIPVDGFLNGFTSEEAVLEAKRCMNCDCRKSESCKLRLYSQEYNIDRKKYSSANRKAVRKHFQHEVVVYEPEKCIRCGLCIEITASRGEVYGLTYIGRGFDVRVEIPFNKELGEALTMTALECIDACPTGALSLNISGSFRKS